MKALFLPLATRFPTLPLALPPSVLDVAEDLFAPLDAHEPDHVERDLPRGGRYESLVHRPHALVPHRLDDACLLYTSPSPRDGLLSRMPSSA